MRFENYPDAHHAAQDRANRTGQSVGIHKTREYGRDGFNVSFIPGIGFRFGSDYLCEVVEPR